MILESSGFWCRRFCADCSNKCSGEQACGEQLLCAVKQLLALLPRKIRDFSFSGRRKFALF